MKPMKMFCHLALTVSSIFFGAETYASDYEDTWIGFQRFLTAEDQVEWLFQCGPTYDEFMVRENFKLVKEGRALIFHQIDEQDLWRPVKAKITATTIMFRVGENVRVTIKDVQDDEALVRTMAPLVNTSRLSVYNFESHFNIRNEMDVASRIHLDEGYACLKCGGDDQRIVVDNWKDSDTVIATKKKMSWTTTGAYQISTGDIYDCRSLRPL